MLDTSIEDARWDDIALEAVAERVLAAALPEVGLSPDMCEVSLLGCDDSRIAELNADFRDKPRPTNVLSWPEEDLAADLPGGVPAMPEADFTGVIALGDIAIAWDTCAREAEAAGKAMQDHVTHLVLHGLLHLLGYDHIRDEDATLMEALEVRILGKLGVDDPYRE